jgi:hypothetical protein
MTRQERAVAEWEDRLRRSRKLRLLSIDIEQEFELLRCYWTWARTPTSERSE